LSAAGRQDEWDSLSALGWALRFTHGKAVPITEPALSEAGPHDWVWAHYRLGDVRAQAMLKARPDLPAGAHEVFALHDDRIFIAQEDGWVFGALPDLERDLGGTPQREARLAFAIRGRRMMTGRLHALRAVDDVRRRAERGVVLPDPAAAFAAVVEAYVDVVERLLDELGDRLSIVEDHVLTEPQDPRHPDLSRERRRLARYRRELQGLRSALARAQGGRHGEHIELVAGRAPELLAQVEDVDREAAALQERGRLLYEEIDTLINAATNRNMRTLTVISTLLVPPTLITGLFGMNLGGLPWQNSPTGFVIGCGICLVVVGAALWLLRRLQMI
jgi:zinc transporter